MKKKSIIAGAAFVAAAVVFIVFLPSLENGFVWDDRYLVVENPVIRSMDAAFFKRAFVGVAIQSWYPLTTISFALDYALWALEPRGFHLTNILLHSINTFLVVILVYRLVELGSFRSPSGDLNRTALMAGVVTALFFGLHPLRVESVVWISERKDVLYALFYLLSMLAYLSYATRKSHRAGYYCLVLVLFALSLLSKPMAVTLPVVLLILDFCPLGRLTPEGGLKNASRLLLEKAPFFLLALLATLPTVLGHTSPGPVDDLDVHTPGVRLLVAVRGYFFYLYKSVLPLDLSPHYPYPLDVSLFSFEYAACMVLVSAVMVYCIVTYKKKPFYSAAWLYFLVTLMPVTDIIQVGKYGLGRYAAADRYTYLPSLAILLLAALAVAYVFKRAPKGRLRALVVAAVLAVLIAFSLLTVRQTAFWKDPITLWSYEIGVHPDRAFMAYNLRGLAYATEGDDEAALKDYTRAIELNPRHAKMYFVRGNAYVRLGMFKEAISDYVRALEFYPDDTQIHYNRAVALMGLDQPRRAIRDYTTVIETMPGMAKAYFGRGNAYAALGKTAEAVKDYTRVIELNPADARAHYNRAVLYLRSGDDDRALAGFKRAAELGNVEARDLVNRLSTK